MKPVKVALFGGGSMSAVHARAAQSQGGEVVAVSSRDPSKMAEGTRSLGLNTYTDAREMIERERPDALVINVIPGAHRQAGAEALAVEFGLPFLVEKPLADDFETAREIASLVDSAQLPNTVGYQFEYGAPLAVARELIGCERIVQVGGGWESDTPAPAWWNNPATSGGQHTEQTTHFFHMARRLVGEAEVLSAEYTRLPDGFDPRAELPYASEAKLAFANGARGTIRSARDRSPDTRIGLEVTLESGRSLFIGRKTLTVTEGGISRDVKVPEINTHELQAAAFLKAVRGDLSDVKTTVQDALKTQKLTTDAETMALAAHLASRAG